MKIKKAVIPLASLGRRFLSATKVQSKEILAIVDKPANQYLVEEAVLSGTESILIITGKNKKYTEDSDISDRNIHYSCWRPAGTSGGGKQIWHYIGCGIA